MSSIFENPVAFKPFFNDEIFVAGVRPYGSFRTGALKACVLDCSLEEPFAEDSVASQIKCYAVLIRVADWPEASPPQIGDRVGLASGSELAVMSFEIVDGEYVMEARTC